MEGQPRQVFPAIRITEGVVIACVAASLSVWGSSQVQRVELNALQKAVTANTAELRQLSASLSAVVTLEHRMAVSEERLSEFDARLRQVERLAHSDGSKASRQW